MDKKIFNQIRTLILHKFRFSYRVLGCDVLYITYPNGSCQVPLFDDETVYLFLYQMYHHKNALTGDIHHKSSFKRAKIDGIIKSWKKQNSNLLKGLHTSYLKAA